MCLIETYYVSYDFDVGSIVAIKSTSLVISTSMRMRSDQNNSKVMVHTLDLTTYSEGIDYE